MERYEIEKIPLEERRTASNTYEMIKRGTSINPGAPALTMIASGDDYDKPSQVTHGEFLAKVTRTANLLRDLHRGGRRS